jgi:hypothetical protein
LRMPLGVSGNENLDVLQLHHALVATWRAAHDSIFSLCFLFS